MTAIGYLSESFEMLTFWEVGWVFVHSSVAMAPSLSPLAGLLHFFFFFFFSFFFACLQPSFGRVSQTEVLVSTALRRVAQAAVASAF